MWVAIVGSRSFDDCGCPPMVSGIDGAHRVAAQYAEGTTSCSKMTLHLLILEVLARLGKKPGIEGIVSGGAKGVDSMAVELAQMYGFKTRVYRPESEKGKTFVERAYKRNSRIVKQADMVIAIYDPRRMKSPGTGDTVAKAQTAGKEVHVWYGRWERRQAA